MSIRTILIQDGEIFLGFKDNMLYLHKYLDLKKDLEFVKKYRTLIDNMILEGCKLHQPLSNLLRWLDEESNQSSE